LSERPWPEPPAPPPELSASIKKQCTGNLKARRGLSAAQRVALSVVFSALVVGMLTYLSAGSERPDGALRAALFGAAGWGLVQAAVLGVGLAQPPGKRVARHWRLAVAVGVPVLFLAYLALAASTRLPLGEFFHGHHAGGAVGCGLHALLFGAIAAGGTLFVWRGTDPLTPGLSGALAGLVGGLAGSVAIGVACPSGETWHLWIGHGVAVLLLAFAGWLVGRRWLAP
jgi:hypothetical protein